ncbi:MAG: nucleotidyltransferase family protein [Marinifilaceae bacterium]|nr:nucleotidyltransferase family protein [Marinifilaceae bacterium]
MKSTRECIELLRKFKEQEAAAYGISRLCLFGSVARGEQVEGSDVDVCIECPPMGLFKMGHLKYRLEQLFGCKVDLVRLRKQMNELLRGQIEKEGIYV